MEARSLIIEATNVVERWKVSGWGLSITNTYVVDVMSSVRSERREMSRQSERASRAGRGEIGKQARERKKGMHNK